MIHSMTGFGRGEAADALHSVEVEISSLNRKQAEVIVNLPRHLQELEARVRKLVLARISRGRVQLQITVQAAGDGSDESKLDLNKVCWLEEQFLALSQSIGRSVLPEPTDFLSIPGVWVKEEVAPAELWPLVEESVTTALTAMIQMREREGRDLLEDAEIRLRSAERTLAQIEARAPEVIQNYRSNLINRLSELQAEGQSWQDDERIIKEIALYADRSDISEEITRFRSHLEKFHDYLMQSEPVGRSLDFLCQEFNRELNTISSKANDATLAQLVVAGKTEVEKIREQIQNVE